MAAEKDRMAAEQETVGEPEAEAKRGISKVMVIVGGLAIVVCAGAGAFLSLGTDLFSGTSTEAVEVDSFLSLGEMTVNLASGNTLLRLRLELATPASKAAEVEKVVNRIRDAFNDFLRQVDTGDLRGSAGMYWLRSELLHRAREIAGEKAIREVLIQDFLVR